ncbi:MAG: vWA domain-containing protein [Chitinophagaceae bacterium]
MPRFENISYIYWLVALAIPIIAFRYIIQWKKKTVRKIGDQKLVLALIGEYSSEKFKRKFILQLTALIILVIALCNLQYSKGGIQIKREGVDVMIALDVSKSMLAGDVQPTRLERAKQLAYKIIDRLGSNRVGLVLFAGRAYLQMPLTTDLPAAKLYVNTASTASVPVQGTVIGEALSLCNNAFDPNQKKYKSVVLITDGEDHDETAMEIVGKMHQEGVLIHTVGVGSEAGATILDPKTKSLQRDINGTTVLTKLNQEALMEIAEKGSGQYQLLKDANAVASNIMNDIDGMEKKTIEDITLMDFGSFFQFFVAISILLLIAEFFLSETQKREG